MQALLLYLLVLEMNSNFLPFQHFFYQSRDSSLFDFWKRLLYKCLKVCNIPYGPLRRYTWGITWACLLKTIQKIITPWSVSKLIRLTWGFEYVEYLILIFNIICLVSKPASCATKIAEEVIEPIIFFIFFSFPRINLICNLCREFTFQIEVLLLKF